MQECDTSSQRKRGTSRMYVSSVYERRRNFELIHACNKCKIIFKNETRSRFQRFVVLSNEESSGTLFYFKNRKKERAREGRFLRVYKRVRREKEVVGLERRCDGFGGAGSSFGRNEEKEKERILRNTAYLCRAPRDQVVRSGWVPGVVEINVVGFLRRPQPEPYAFSRLSALTATRAG